MGIVGCGKDVIQEILGEKSGSPNPNDIGGYNA